MIQGKVALQMDKVLTIDHASRMTDETARQIRTAERRVRSTLNANRWNRSLLGVPR